MSEAIPQGQQPEQYSSPRLPDFDFRAINQAIAEIGAQSEVMDDDDSRSYVAGIVGDGTFVSVEVKTGEDGDENFVVRSGQAADLGLSTTLDGARALPRIDLAEEVLTSDSLSTTKDGSIELATKRGVLHVPSPEAREQGDFIKLDGLEVIKLESETAPEPPDPEEVEAKKTAELLNKNFASMHKILRDQPTTVYDPETKQPVKTGVVRRIGFDKPNNNNAYLGDFESGIYEKTHEGSDKTFFEFRGFANRPEARFYGRHCIWQLDPSTQAAQVSVKDPETGEYGPFEPMDKNDQAQLRFSMFDAYRAAMNGVDGRRIWDQKPPLGAKFGKALGIFRRK